MIKFVMCTDAWGALGYKGDLIYKISDDLKRFKQLTKGSIVVMGRKTLESLPNQHLPERINVVLTSDKKYKPKNSSVIVMHDIDNIINHYYNGVREKDIFIIGGAEIYNLFFEYVDVVYHTKVLEQSSKADTFFNIDSFEYESHFTCCNIETHFSDKYKSLYQFKTFVRNECLLEYYEEEIQKNNPAD